VDHYFYPRSFSPPPPLIEIPPACPKPIRREVEAAFGLYWHDHGASLNRIRVAIELLLTDTGVKRYGKKKKGGRYQLVLDQRIEVLRSTKPSLSGLCDSMLAVKHLGNAGSHPEEVKRDDVFDALDILEQVLLETYSNPESELAKMVRQINKRKGPRKARY
jgi:hypothetical protein